MLESASRGGGGVWSRGGLLPGGGLVRGGISQHALRQTPAPVDRQTPVKILPWPNFVAAGKNESDFVALAFAHIGGHSLCALLSSGAGYLSEPKGSDTREA